MIDECIAPTVAHWLREQGHDVASVSEVAAGGADEEVIRRARHENRLLITSDKDFGELVHRERWAHAGIILLRLQDQRKVNQLKVIRGLLQNEAPLAGRYAVVGDDGLVRFAGE